MSEMISRCFKPIACFKHAMGNHNKYFFFFKTLCDLSRSARFVPPQVQHHPFPLLQPVGDLLLREPQRQILLALHDCTHSHDACGRAADPALHQQVRLSTRAHVLQHRKVEFQPFNAHMLFIWFSPFFLFFFFIWTIQMFSVWGSISGGGGPQSGPIHSYLPPWLEESLDWLLLPHGGLLTADYRWLIDLDNINRANEVAFRFLVSQSYFWGCLTQ